MTEIAASATVSDDLVGRIVPFQDIPMVDLAGLTGGTRAADVAASLRHAAETVGFLYVTGHGVPDDLVAAMFAESQAFFDRPLDAKMTAHIKNSPVHRGYFPLFEENTDPTLTADLKEGFDIGRDLGPDTPEVRRGLPLHLSLIHISEPTRPY